MRWRETRGLRLGVPSTNALLAVLLFAAWSEASAAGMACWSSGVSECRVTELQGSATLCRTPSADGCQLTWDPDSVIPDRVAFLAGAIYESPSSPLVSASRIAGVEASDSESDVRNRLATVLRVPSTSLVRRAAWFYMNDADGVAALDEAALPESDLCVAIGFGHRVMRLKVSSCGPKSGGQTLVDSAFLSEDQAFVVPFKSHGRSFVALLLNRTIEGIDRQSQSASRDAVWFSKAAEAQRK